MVIYPQDKYNKLNNGCRQSQGKAVVSGGGEGDEGWGWYDRGNLGLVGCELCIFWIEISVKDYTGMMEEYEMAIQ